LLNGWRFVLGSLSNGATGHLAYCTKISPNQD
jgi:hypothetical protein